MKVKMPNFRKPKNGSSVTKELLMSVIGTTISIVLTFGTAYLIDNHQRKAEGRDIAMMVIHDIDQYVEIFRDEAKEDTERHDLTMYVLEHIDSIRHLLFTASLAIMCSSAWSAPISEGQARDIAASFMARLMPRQSLPRLAYRSPRLNTVMSSDQAAYYVFNAADGYGLCGAT